MRGEAMGCERVEGPTRTVRSGLAGGALSCAEAGDLEEGLSGRVASLGKGWEGESAWFWGRKRGWHSWEESEGRAGATCTGACRLSSLPSLVLRSLFALEDPGLWNESCFLGRCVVLASCILYLTVGCLFCPPLCRGPGGHAQWQARSPGPGRNEAFSRMGLELYLP